MNAPRIARFGLQARLALARFGLVPGAACLLGLAGLCAWLWLVPHLRNQEQNQLRALDRARLALRSADAGSSAPAEPRSAAQERLAVFYDTLGDAHYAEQQVKTLFAIAAKNGLVLNLADYKFGEDRNGRYRTYQIVLPVKGPYGAIRQFCEQTLLAIPFASLDEMNFKRDAIANRTLEARLRFTLYLNDRQRAGEDRESAADSGAKP